MAQPIIVNEVIACFVGAHYELTGTTVTKYYYAGTQRIAMRKAGELYYLLGDHLGSTSLVTDSAGTVVSETKYKAWGEVRYTSGTEMTKYQYTGQYSHTMDFGLMFYNARWYDPALGRFAQADTIVPGGVQGLDRYSYVNNSPMNFVDPSGHVPVDCYGTNYCGASNANLLSNGTRASYGKGLIGPPTDNGNSSNSGDANIGEDSKPSLEENLESNNENSTSSEQLINPNENGSIIQSIPIYDTSVRPPKLIGYKITSLRGEWDSVQFNPNATQEVVILDNLVYSSLTAIVLEVVGCAGPWCVAAQIGIGSVSAVNDMTTMNSHTYTHEVYFTSPTIDLTPRIETTTGEWVFPDFDHRYP